MTQVNMPLTESAQSPSDVSVRVAKFYRPENTHRGAVASYQADMNRLYWSEEGKAVNILTPYYTILLLSLKITLNMKSFQMLMLSVYFHLFCLTETWITFSDITGKCFVTFQDNLFDKTNDDLMKELPHHFYFAEAYDASRKAFVEPPLKAQNMGRLGKVSWKTICHKCFEKNIFHDFIKHYSCFSLYNL